MPAGPKKLVVTVTVESDAGTPHVVLCELAGGYDDAVRIIREGVNRTKALRDGRAKPLYMARRNRQANAARKATKAVELAEDAPIEQVIDQAVHVLNASMMEELTVTDYHTARNMMAQVAERSAALTAKQYGGSAHESTSHPPA